MNTNYIQTNNATEAVKLINKIRLNNSNKWYYIQITSNGVTYDIKAFNTWLQIFSNGNTNYSNSMDQTIKQYKQHLFEILN